MRHALRVFKNDERDLTAAQARELGAVVREEFK